MIKELSNWAVVYLLIANTRDIYLGTSEGVQVADSRNG